MIKQAYITPKTASISSNRNNGTVLNKLHRLHVNNDKSTKNEIEILTRTKALTE